MYIIGKLLISAHYRTYYISKNKCFAAENVVLNIFQENKINKNTYIFCNYNYFKLIKIYKLKLSKNNDNLK